MIRKIFIAALLLSSTILAGCGGGSDAPPRFTGQILSSQRSDGDIESNGGVFTVTPAAVSGIPVYGLGTANEFRAFVTFPLDGSAGGAIIPVDARVLSADLELHVNRVDLAVIPTLLDLIAYPLTGPTPADFNSPPLAPTAFRTFNMFSTDVGNFVRIDVTPLVREAILQGRNEVQFRLMTDFSSTAVGLAGFDDDVAATAPLLTINYE